MKLNYIVKDDSGNVGQTLPITQGETRVVSVFLFNPDGTPLDYSATITEIFVKVYSNVSAASIHKKLSLSEVTAITKGGPLASNLIGFQFALAAADTGIMAANNSGLPMIATITDSGGKILELDFIAVFNVSLPAVQT